MIWKSMIHLKININIELLKLTGWIKIQEKMNEHETLESVKRFNE